MMFVRFLIVNPLELSDYKEVFAYDYFDQPELELCKLQARISTIKNSVHRNINKFYATRDTINFCPMKKMIPYIRVTAL